MHATPPAPVVATHESKGSARFRGFKSAIGLGGGGGGGGVGGASSALRYERTHSCPNVTPAVFRVAAKRGRSPSTCTSSTTAARPMGIGEMSRPGSAVDTGRERRAAREAPPPSLVDEGSGPGVGAVAFEFEGDADERRGDADDRSHRRGRRGARARDRGGSETDVPIVVDGEEEADDPGPTTTTTEEDDEEEEEKRASDAGGEIRERGAERREQRELVRDGQPAGSARSIRRRRRLHGRERFGFVVRGRRGGRRWRRRRRRRRGGGDATKRAKGTPGALHGGKVTPAGNAGPTRARTAT